MSDQPTQICDNCLKPVPQSKIATHFGYCRRNIKRCQKCGEMYDINFKQEHQQQFHKLAPCKHCKKQFKPNEVAKHEETCSAKTQFCQYCELNVPAKDFPSHLKACQARTKNCQKCRKPIANKDYLVHMIECPGYIQQPQPKIQPPSKYSNYNQYLANNARRQENVKRQHKFAHQQPPRQRQRQYGVQGTKHTQKRQQPKYGNVYYANNKPSSNYQVKPSNQTRGSNKNIDLRNQYNLNQPSKKADVKQQIKSKYQFQGISDKRPIQNQREYQRVTENTRGIKPSSKVNYPSSNGASHSTNNKYQPSIQIRSNGTTNYPSSTNNTRLSSQNPLRDYPKVQEPYKKQVPRQKQRTSGFVKKQATSSTSQNTYASRQPQKKEFDYNQYVNDYQDFENYPNQTYQQPYRNVQPPSNNNFGQQFGGLEEDEQLQKAIMLSMGMGGNTPSSNKYIKPKTNYKMDDIPPQLLDEDMMNQSFYDKQRALMEEFQKKPRRR